MNQTRLFIIRPIRSFSLLVLVVQGIVYSSSALSAPAPELVIYSGRSEKLLKPVVDAFTKATRIKVIIHGGSSAALLETLKREQKNPVADIYISNDAANLDDGNKAELFAPVTNKIAAVISPQFRAQDKHWLGLSARASVLVVNTKMKDISFVKSVFDLADPRLKGKIAITTSRNESYIAGTTVYMLSTDKNKIIEWLKGLKKNSKGQVYSKHTQIVAAVAEGKKEIGLVNHYSIYRYLNKHPNAPIRILFPDQESGESKAMGIAWNITGAAITLHSKHKTLAMKFMAFVTSVKGQKLLTESNYEYPTRSDVSAAAMLPIAKNFIVAPVAMYKLGAQRKAAIELIESVGMP